MEQQYGDDFISITDEDGKEYELEVLAELEHNGSRYLALVPAGSGNDDEEEDLEVSILKSVEETVRNSSKPSKMTRSSRRSTAR